MLHAHITLNALWQVYVNKENGKQWCNFGQFAPIFPRDIFPKASYEQDCEEKYSYLAVYKGKTPNTLYKNEREVKSLEEKSFFWDRIISPNARRSGHTVVRVCNSSGKLESIIVARSHGLEGGYRLAKKAKWGSLWWMPRRIPNKFRKESEKGLRLF